MLALLFWSAAILGVVAILPSFSGWLGEATGFKAVRARSHRRALERIKADMGLR